MKTTNKLKVFFVLIATMCFLACSDDVETKNNRINNLDEGIPVLFDAGILDNNSELMYNLHIFTKTTDENYYFNRSVLLKGVKDKLKFTYSELMSSSYRFLFTATHSVTKEIKVLNKNGNELDDLSKWQDVMIETHTDTLVSIHNYYEVLDKTGTEILDEGTINGNLTRMVGQMVFDIYKVSGSLQDSIDIDSTVLSVIDRVYYIDIEYNGMTKAVSFDASNALIPHVVSQNTFHQYITPQMTGNFQVTVPQEDLGLLAVPLKGNGGVRILGNGLLPSDSIPVKMTFYYYDTTPKCELNHEGAHTESCYEQKTLVLNLADRAAAKGMAINSNYYTVNKAGIKFNRIIDLEHNSMPIIDVEWKN